MRDKLKRDEFDHVVKKMDYDIKVFEIWQSKVASVAMARQHAKQEHVVSEHRKIVESVEAYLDGCVRFLCWEGVNKGSDSIVPQVLSFRMEILRKLRNQNTAGAAADIPTLVLMNWTAPCLFPAGRQNDHINCLAWALHDNTNSAAIIFAPTFSYQKGKHSWRKMRACSCWHKEGTTWTISSASYFLTDAIRETADLCFTLLVGPSQVMWLTLERQMPSFSRSFARLGELILASKWPPRT